MTRVLPIGGQLGACRPEWLKLDVLADLSVAAVALPTAIAYPAIADLPIEVGLCAAIVPAVGYAFFAHRIGHAMLLDSAEAAADAFDKRTVPRKLAVR